MAVNIGNHPGRAPTGEYGPEGPVGDHELPALYERWEIPLAGTNQVSQGNFPLSGSESPWDIRAIIVINRSTKTVLIKAGLDAAWGDLQTEADYEIGPYKLANLPVYRRGIRNLAFSIEGPITTETGSILMIALPIFIAASESDIAPGAGAADSLEVYTNEAFAGGADTGAQAFLEDITSVTLAADTQPMNFYLAKDTASLAAAPAIPLLAGEKLSLAGEFGAYRVVNPGGTLGGYRIFAIYSSIS